MHRCGVGGLGEGLEHVLSIVSGMRLHGAVVFLLLAFAQAVSAAAIGVSNAGQLRHALLDTTVSSVVLQAPVTVDIASFPPINLGHAVTLTAAGSADVLSFSHTREPLIMVGPGAYLELQNLTLARFHPLQALGFTTATSMVPIAALNISATGAAIVFRSCKFLLQSPLADATDSMPFWAEQDQAGFNLLTANGQPAAAVQQFDLVAAKGSMQKSRLSAASMQQIAQLSSDDVYYGGSSRVSITDSLLVIDPQHCYTGQQQLVWDSNSLATALQDAAVREVLVFVDTVLSPLNFSFTQSKLVSSMRISTCSGSPATLDFNMLSQAITLRPGAVLQLTGGLAVRQAAPMDPSISRTNTSNSMAPALQALMASTPALLLLGSVDLSLGAELVVQNASVAVANTSQVWGAYEAVAEASWGQASRPLARQGQGQLGQEGSRILVGLWNVSLQGVGVAGGCTSYSAAGSRLVLQQVEVLQELPKCFSVKQLRDVVAIDSSAELQRLLLHSNVTMFQLLSDITLHESHWLMEQPSGSPSILRPVEIRGCHPDGPKGGRYTIDFSHLEGTASLNVHSMLRFSGDLFLKGMPDRPGSSGSWVLNTGINLVGSGFLEYQGVVLEGYSPSLLLQPDNARWRALPALMPRKGSWMRLSDTAVLLYQYLLPVGEASELFLGSGAALNSQDAGRSRRRLQGEPAHESDSGITKNSSSSNNSSNSSSSNSSSGYHSYIDVTLCLSPAPSADVQPMSAAHVAAIVLGVLLGLVLLALLAMAVLVVRQQRQAALMGAEQHKPWLHGSACCWPKVFAAGAASAGSFAGSVARGPSATAASGLLLQPDAETRLLAGFPAAAGQPQVYSFSHHRPAVVTALTATTADNSNRGFWWPSDSMHHPFPPQGSPPLLDDQLQDNLMHQQLPQYTAAAFFEQGQVTGEALLGAHLAWQPGFQQDRSHHPLDPSHQLSDRGERPGWPAADANVTATEEGTAGLEGAAGLVTGQHKQQLFEAARKQLGAVAGDLARSDALVLEAVLGEGTFGKVFKGYWKGTLVAVKTMMFPAAMSGKEKREKMAIMETAISASLSHPNIVQMYTYYLRPVLVGHEAQMTTLDTPEGHRLDSSSVGDTTLNAAFLSDGVTDMVHSWEVQLVLEYCDQGSLRQLLNKKDSFTRPDGSRDMELILDTALDVARAMLHLHSENIIHSDLKARNILLKSSGGADRRHFVAKVADFGLSMRIDPEATHVSNIYQGTLTHMAPEVMLHGKLSRGSDVYAFGVLLWELYSGGHAFKGIPRALLGHEVAYRQRRPHFPDGSPFDFQLLACRCWESDASIRPSFQEILSELQRMRERLREQAAAASDGAVASAAALPTAGNAAAAAAKAQTVTAAAEASSTPTSPSSPTNSALPTIGDVPVVQCPPAAAAQGIADGPAGLGAQKQMVEQQLSQEGRQQYSGRPKDSGQAAADVACTSQQRNAAFTAQAAAVAAATLAATPAAGGASLERRIAEQELVAQEQSSQQQVTQQQEILQQRRGVQPGFALDDLIKQLSITDSTFSAEHLRMSHMVAKGGAAAAAAAPAAAAGVSSAHADAASAAADCRSTSVAGDPLKRHSQGPSQVLFGMPQRVRGVYYREEISVESDIADAAAEALAADLSPAADVQWLPRLPGPGQPQPPSAAISRSEDAAGREQGQQAWQQRLSLDVWTERQQAPQQPAGSSAGAAEVLQATIDSSQAGQSAPFLHQQLHAPAGHPAQCISDVLPPSRQQQQYQHQDQQQQQHASSSKNSRACKDRWAGDSSSTAARSISVASSGRTIDSSSSSDTPAVRSASAAAMAAVMSLKASLAKQALAANPAAAPAQINSRDGSKSAPLPEVAPLQQGHQQMASAAAVAAFDAVTARPRSQPLPAVFDHADQAASALAVGPYARLSLEVLAGGLETAASSRQELTQPGPRRYSLDARRSGTSAAAVAANGMRQILQRRSDRALVDARPAGQQPVLQQEQLYQQPSIDRARLSVGVRHTIALEQQQQQQQQRPAQVVRFSLDLRPDRQQYVAPHMLHHSSAVPATAAVDPQAAGATAAAGHTGRPIPSSNHTPHNVLTFGGFGSQVTPRMFAAHCDVSAAATAGGAGSAMALGGVVVGSPPLPPGPAYSSTPWPAAWSANRQRPEQQQHHHHHHQQQQPHAPIRKAASASQLGLSALPPGLPTSDPLQNSHQRHRQPLRQASLSGGESSSSHNQRQPHAQQPHGSQQHSPVLPALDQKQLQQLQQIADAAKMQVLVQSAQLPRPAHLPGAHGSAVGSPNLSLDLPFQGAQPPV